VYGKTYTIAGNMIKDLKNAHSTIKLRMGKETTTQTDLRLQIL
jgi:hypothetical protein